MADHTRESRGAKDGRWLALFPVGIAAIMMVLIMPRDAEPTDVPLPMADAKVLARIEKEDAERAAHARAQRLPADVLSLGTALHTFFAGQAKPETEDVQEAKRLLGEAMAGLAQRPASYKEAAELRSLMTEEFLDALVTFEKTGQESKELAENGGVGFIKTMRQAGWVEGNTILAPPATRRAMFKVVWNSVAGLENVPELAISLDEQRSIYAHYLAHPHPADTDRMQLESRRLSASTPSECEKVGFEATRSAETWRLEKIKKLGALDPAYPTQYAMGVALYRTGHYEQSVDAFRTWIDRHPDGTLGLRARNHLRAAASKANGG